MRNKFRKSILVLLIFTSYIATAQTRIWHKEITSSYTVGANKIFLNNNNPSIVGSYSWTTDFDPSAKEELKSILIGHRGVENLDGGYISNYDSLGNFSKLYVDKYSVDQSEIIYRGTKGFLSSAVDKNHNIVGVGSWLIGYKGELNNWEFFLETIYNYSGASSSGYEGGIMDVTFDLQGNIVICGYLSINSIVDFDPTSSVYQLENSSLDKCTSFIAKYSPQGKLLFAKKVNDVLYINSLKSSFYSDQKSQIKVDNNNDIILAGKSDHDFNFDGLGNSFCTSIALRNIDSYYSKSSFLYLAKFSNNGNPKFLEKYCQSARVLSLYDLNIDRNNNIYILGRSVMGLTPFIDNSFENCDSIASSFILKFNTFGSYSNAFTITGNWLKGYGPGGTSMFNTIEIDDLFNIYVGGSIEKPFIVNPYNCENTILTNTSNSNGLIIKFDSSFIYKWHFIDTIISKSSNYSGIIQSIALGKNGSIFYAGNNFINGFSSAFFGKILEPNIKSACDEVLPKTNDSYIKACKNYKKELKVHGPKSAYWYTSLCSNIPIAEGLSFTTPQLTSSTTYYVGDKNCPNGNRIALQIAIQDSPANLEINYMPDSVCFGSKIRLKASSKFGTPRWKYNIPNDTTIKIYKDTAFTVSVRDIYNCDASKTFNVKLIPERKNMLITNLNPKACQGDTLKFEFKNVAFENLVIFDDQNRSYNMIPEILIDSKFYTFYDFESNNYGRCDYDTTIVMNYVKLNVRDTTICVNNKINLVGSSYYSGTYSWSGGISNGIDFYPKKTNTYYLKSIVKGCVSIDSSTIVVVNLPKLNYEQKQYCEGDVLNFSCDYCSGLEIVNKTGKTSYSYNIFETGLYSEIELPSDSSYITYQNDCKSVKDFIFAVKYEECLLLSNEDQISTNLNKNLYFNVYPNPLSNSQSIKVSSNENIQSLQLLSIDGKLFQTLDMRSYPILELIKLNKGIYMLKYITSNGLVNYKKLFIE